MEGLEPSRSKGSTDFKSVASTNSATTPLELFLLFIKYTEKSRYGIQFLCEKFLIESNIFATVQMENKKKLSFFFLQTLDI